MNEKTDYHCLQLSGF